MAVHQFFVTDLLLDAHNFGGGDAVFRTGILMAAIRKQDPETVASDGSEFAGNITTALKSLLFGRDFLLSNLLMGTDGDTPQNTQGRVSWIFLIVQCNRQ